MKCDDCINLLEAYLDGEASGREAEAVRSHLMSCAACEDRFAALTAENEIYARYDGEISISPAIWNGVAARINAEDRQSERDPKSGLVEWLSGLFAIPSLRFAMPTVALVAIAVVVGLAYWKTRPQPSPSSIAVNNANPPSPTKSNEPPVKTPQGGSQNKPDDGQRFAPLVAGAKTKRPTINRSRSTDQSDVLPDTAATSGDPEDRDTASHLEQAQNLLTSFRDIKYSNTDEEVDVSYEKAESRRLLSENVVLRRDAEQAGKFPAKSMLGSLEPFLIDIANLPDKAKPTDVRQITDRVQKTEIVAELRGY